MSARPRCHLCGHRVGPRNIGNLTKEGEPKKSPCDCACHERREVMPDATDDKYDAI